jgi:hypothetical protein
MPKTEGATRDVMEQILGDLRASGVPASTLLPIQLPRDDFVEQVERKSFAGILC